jgi:hypothetical protein
MRNLPHGASDRNRLSCGRSVTALHKKGLARFLRAREVDVGSIGRFLHFVVHHARLVAAACALLLTTPAAAVFTTGTDVWVNRCQTCHGTSPSTVARLNAGGNSSTVIDYVILHQASMAANANVVALVSSERVLVSQYILGFVPGVSASPAFQTAIGINVGTGINLGSVSFTGVQTVTNPTHGTLSVWSGTTVTYTPAAGYTGPDSFTYRGFHSATGTGAVLGDPRTVTISVQPPPVPVISSGSAVGGTVGQFLSYTIVASNSPTSWGATSLPPGVTRTNSVISGTPTTAGSFPGTISATNAGGTDTNSITYTIAKGSQTITFPVQSISSRTFAPGSTFAISPLATSSSTLTPTYSSLSLTVCTVSGTTVTMVNAGTCTIAADQSGNVNYNAAPQATRSVLFTQASQTISFPAQTTASRPWASGGTFAISPLATASSGLAVTYGSSTGSVCTVSGTTVTILTAGTCTITANQSGNANFLAAGQVTQAVTVVAIAPAAPTSVVGSPGPNQATLSFVAPASDGGSPITGYKGTCTAGGSFTGTSAGSPVTVTGLANGTLYACSVQALTAPFPTGGSSSANVGVTPSPAAVAPSFVSASAVTFTVGSFGSFTATASGTPSPTVTLGGIAPAVAGVGFASGTGSGTLSGTPGIGTGAVGTHTVVVNASNAAGNATQSISLTVAKRAQVMSFTVPADQPYTADPIPLVASSSTGLPVTFATTTSDVCDIFKDGLSVILLDVGDCVLIALQAGDADTLPANSGKQVVAISPASQDITFDPQLPQAFVPGGAFEINPPATATSRLPVSYATSTPAICSVAGTVVTMNGVGTCTLVASQPGDSRYLPAPDVKLDVAIVPASQSISFAAQAIATRAYAAGLTFAINPLATASSGLQVTYSSLSPSVCTVSGTTVTVVAIGACVIAADQLGSAVFAAAAQVTRSVTINPTVPGAPSMGLASPGNSQASIDFSPSSNDGGSSVTSFTATCNPGAHAASGAASPITVAGLANGTTYTCSVTATNIAGTGPASLTAPVTPAASAAAGGAKWGGICQSCHGILPNGNRFNAVADSTAVLDYVFLHQPTMNQPPTSTQLAALTPQDRSDIIAYIAGFLPQVQAVTAPNIAKQVSVSDGLTLNSTALTYDAIQLITPPAHGTLGAFNGVFALYTPAPGFSGTDTFTYRAINTTNAALVSSTRTAIIDVNAAEQVLTVQLAGPASGSVASFPDGIDCGLDCDEAYDPDTSVTLVATPSGAAAFGGWSGACTGLGDCVIGMDAAKSVTATFTFAPGTQFPLSVSRTGAGNGSVASNPAGIACGATCNANFDAGTPVILQATPAAGSVFAQWSGACGGSGNCLVTMDAARSVAASFSFAPGVLSASPPSIDFGAQSMGTTSPVQTVTFTNTGGAPLTVSSITPGDARFAVTNTCGTLGPGASCTASVTFSPPPVLAMPLNGTQPAASALAVSHDGQGVTSVGLQGMAEKSLVTHYYRAILRRAPDSGGHDFWQGQAASLQAQQASINETWFAMAMSFYGSAEYLAFGRDDAGFVTDLYTTFFNRPPDSGGLGFWTSQLAAGMPREVVLAAFMFSSEFATFAQAIFGNIGARAEVTMAGDFYRGLLARLPDSGGLTFWVNQFRTAQCTGAAAGVAAQANAISQQFLASGEYLSRARSNAQYVGDLYNAFLRRGGDLAGVQFWIQQLGSGMPREQVRQSFAASAEFQGRIANVVAQGCAP